MTEKSYGLASTLLALSTLVFSHSSTAAEQEGILTYNLAVVSDYVFDGKSQTDNQAAIQGGIDVAADNGWYAGAWASTVDFSHFGDDETSLETDWYLGYLFSDDEVSYDIGAVFYHYEGGLDTADYLETYAGISVDNNFVLKAWYSNNFAHESYSSLRIKVAYNVEFNDRWAMPLEFTHTRPTDQGGDDYNAYRIGLATTISYVGVDLSYWKTNIDAAGLAANKDNFYTQGGFVLSISNVF